MHNLGLEHSAVLLIKDLLHGLELKLIPLYMLFCCPAGKTELSSYKQFLLSVRSLLASEGSHND